MDRRLGTIRKLDIGVGAWVLAGDDGITYELRDLPDALQQAGLRVALIGEIVAEGMSIAMVGPIFAVVQGTVL